MRRFGIPQRLYAIIGLGGFGLVVGTAVFVGLLFHVSHTLGTLHTEMRQHDHTRIMQVAFTQQVREWKNILLRGHNPADLAAYRASLAKESDVVRATGEALRRTVRDAKARELLDQFLDAHHAMGRRYDEALEHFLAGRGLDPRAADKLVRGQDRAPADLLEQIVARIDVLSNVEAEVSDIRREALEIAAAIAGFLVLLMVGSSVVSRSITQPIAKTVVALERLATGDLRYRVSITGNDEVARMNRALNATVEAIQRTHEQLGEAAAAAEAGRQRLAILHEIDRAILAIHSPTTIAEIALRHLRGLVRAPRAVLALYDVAAGVGTFLAVDVEGPTERPAGVQFPLVVQLECWLM